MPFVKYQDEFRAALVAFLIANGYPTRPGSVRYTQRITGVDKGQLRRWYANQDKYCGGEVQVKLKMLELQELLEKEIVSALGIMAAKRENASYKDLSFTVAVYTDKVLAMQGKASNVTENRVNTWQDLVNRENQRFNPVEETKALDDGSN